MRASERKRGSVRKCESERERSCTCVEGGV